MFKYFQRSSFAGVQFPSSLAPVQLLDLCLVWLCLIVVKKLVLGLPRFAFFFSKQLMVDCLAGTRSSMRRIWPKICQRRLVTTWEAGSIRAFTVSVFMRFGQKTPHTYRTIFRLKLSTNLTIPLSIAPVLQKKAWCFERKLCSSLTFCFCYARVLYFFLAWALPLLLAAFAFSTLALYRVACPVLSHFSTRCLIRFCESQFFWNSFLGSTFPIFSPLYLG